MKEYIITTKDNKHEVTAYGYGATTAAINALHHINRESRCINKKGVYMGRLYTINELNVILQSCYVKGF